MIKRERTQYSWATILQKSMHRPNELLAASPLETRPLLFSPDNCWQNIFAKHSPTLLKAFVVLLCATHEGCMRIFVSQSISFCQGSCGVLSLLAIFCRWMEGKREKKFLFHLHRWYSFLAVVVSAYSEQYSAAVSLLWSPTSNGTMATCKDVLSA